jgi:hypothetical protein
VGFETTISVFHALNGADTVTGHKLFVFSKYIKYTKKGVEEKEKENK